MPFDLPSLLRVAAFVTVVGLFIQAGAAWAADGQDTARAIAAKLGYQEDDQALLASSKVWPADARVTLVALAVPSGNQQDEDSTIYDLVVLTADSKSGKVLAKRRDKKAITSDAVRLTGISIDTGRYNLADQVRAFGVRLSFEGSSRVNQASFRVLSLYVVSGKNVERVLDPMTVGSSNSESDQECAGSSTDIDRTLQLKESVNTGYRDLAISGTQTDRVSKPGKTTGECRESSTSHPLPTYELKFDGKRYPLPKELVWK